MSRLIGIFVICLLALATSDASASSASQQIGAVLDDWHQAASVADEARYFGHFAPNGIFMGTDATERWTVAEFRAWATPRFQAKAAWSFKPHDRHIDFSADRKTAWFDEMLGSSLMLDTWNLGPCHGSASLFHWAGSGRSRNTTFRSPFRTPWWALSCSRSAGGEHGAR